MASIGVIDVGRQGWTGGAVYSSVMTRSLTAAASDGTEIVFLTDSERSVEGARTMRYASVSPLPLENSLRGQLGLPARVGSLPGEARMRRTLRLSDPSDPLWTAERHGVDAVFPVLRPIPGGPRRRARTGLVGWLPDFQHLHLPEYFNEHEHRRRRRAFASIVSNCHRVVVSSDAVRRDVVREYPEAVARVRVVPFPSRFAFRDPAVSPDDVTRRYHLPRRFLLCANQFWAHKNHVALLEAVAILKGRGLVVPVVLTGLPLDTRSRDNAPTSAILQAVARGNLSGQAFVLGLVPRDDLEGLLRGATAVVQPSLSEGWNTTVQDAKALGRPLVCADTPVLREQAPDAAFFAADPESMADCIERVWHGAVDVPADEAGALADQREHAKRHGESLLTVCREAMREVGRAC